MKEIEVGFSPQQKNSQGTHFVRVSTETLWYIDPQLNKLRDRSIRLPDLLANLHGYRDLKRQHKKIPELKVDELEQHCNNLGEILSSPCFMKKQFAVFREAMTDFHDVYRSMLIICVKEKRMQVTEMIHKNQSEVSKIIGALKK